MKRVCIVFALAICVAIPALGDMLGNPTDGSTTVSLAQDWVHPATVLQNTWVLSDFVTSVDYYLHDVVSAGRATAARDGDGANFDVWDGLPWEGGSVVMSASGGYDALDSSGTIGADFQGQLLPAGSYYIAFQSVRDFLNTGGNSLIFHTLTGNEDDWQWNPGEGQGFGPYRPVQTTEGEFRDVNWQLNAEPVPEPACVLLLCTAGCLLRRR